MPCLSKLWGKCCFDPSQVEYKKNLALSKGIYADCNDFY